MIIRNILTIRERYINNIFVKIKYKSWIKTFAKCIKRMSRVLLLFLLLKSKEIRF